MYLVHTSGGQEDSRGVGIDMLASAWALSLMCTAPVARGLGSASRCCQNVPGPCTWRAGGEPGV